MWTVIHPDKGRRDNGTRLVLARCGECSVSERVMSMSDVNRANRQGKTCRECSDRAKSGA